MTKVYDNSAVEQHGEFESICIKNVKNGGGHNFKREDHCV